MALIDMVDLYSCLLKCLQWGDFLIVSLVENVDT